MRLSRFALAVYLVAAVASAAAQAAGPAQATEQGQPSTQTVSTPTSLLPRLAYVSPAADPSLSFWTELVKTAIGRKASVVGSLSPELVDQSVDANVIISVAVGKDGLGIAINDRFGGAASKPLSFVFPDSASMLEFADEVGTAIAGVLPPLPPREKEVTVERVVTETKVEEGSGVALTISARPGSRLALGRLGTLTVGKDGRLRIEGLPEQSMLVGIARRSGYRDTPFALNVGSGDSQATIRQTPLSSLVADLEYNINGIGFRASWRIPESDIRVLAGLDDNWMLNIYGAQVYDKGVAVPVWFPFIRPVFGAEFHNNESEALLLGNGIEAGFGMYWRDGQPHLSDFSRAWIDLDFKLGVRTNLGALYFKWAPRFLYAPGLAPLESYFAHLDHLMATYTDLPEGAWSDPLLVFPPLELGASPLYLQYFNFSIGYSLPIM